MQGSMGVVGIRATDALTRNASLHGEVAKRCGFPTELRRVTTKRATLPPPHIPVVPARPGPARVSHRLPPAPSRIDPRHSPCSGRVSSRRLRALAGPGGYRGPGCPAQRCVGSGLPSPPTVPGRTAVRLTPAAGSRPVQGAGIEVHLPRGVSATAVRCPEAAAVR